MGYGWLRVSPQIKNLRPGARRKAHMIMRVAAITAVALLCLTGISWAESLKGTKELGFNVSSQNLDVDGSSARVSTTMISVLYGVFITEQIEAGGAVNIIESEGGSVETTQTGVEFHAKFHFIGANPVLLPYIGLELGVYSLDSGGNEYSGNSTGIMGGAKYFMSSTSSVNLEYNLRNLEMEDKRNRNYDATATTLNIGYSVYF